MRKKFTAVTALMLAMGFVLGSCGGSSGGKDSQGNSEPTSSGSGAGSNIEFDLDGFNADHYPDMANMKQQEGKIDVVILFEGTEKGWEALANEYMRIHEGVAVSLNSTYTAANYPTKLNSEVTGGKTEWDIVQGNLFDGNNLKTYCLNMSSAIEAENAYAGEDYLWKDVLERNAYITDQSGKNTATYIMNSEGLQTAWFVNDVAFDAAVGLGYLNEEGKAETPITWDDLMSLCSYMQDAGYSNPLGISVSSDSVSASQFTWLLRIYGDYYYRNEYDNIMVDDSYEVDLSSQNPEADANYFVSDTKLYNAILDEDSANYVGAFSGKFQDFLSQFGKMEDFLAADAGSISMDQMRDRFRQQSKGMESPQIMLDYAGSGLAFKKAETDSFKMDYFDYPVMVSDYIDRENTVLRDVGGNGGYLSIVVHNNDQNQLNLDFMKFVMSPYGQSIYYKALNEKNVVPKGLTTVLPELVLVPQEWKEFFEDTSKISFTGLSDSNPFVSALIRDLNGEAISSAKAIELWNNYLVLGTEDVDGFSGEWQDALEEDWKTFCRKNNWNVNCYKYPGKDTSYGG